MTVIDAHIHFASECCHYDLGEVLDQNLKKYSGALEWFQKFILRYFPEQIIAANAIDSRNYRCTLNSKLSQTTASLQPKAEMILLTVERLGLPFSASDLYKLARVTPAFSATLLIPLARAAMLIDEKMGTNNLFS